MGFTVIEIADFFSFFLSFFLSFFFFFFGKIRGFGDLIKIERETLHAVKGSGQAPAVQELCRRHATLAKSDKQIINSQTRSGS